MNDNPSLPTDSVWIRAVDLNSQIQSDESDIPLGTLTLRGDNIGTTEIDVMVTQMDDGNGNLINPSFETGCLRVGSKSAGTGSDGDGAGSVSIGGGGSGIEGKSEESSHPKIKTNSKGKVLFAYTRESSDKKARLIIPKGTAALDFKGRPLKDVGIVSTTLGGTVVAAYDLKPDDASFDPKIELVIKYDPEDVVNKDLTIKVFEGGEWTSLETTVDTVINTAAVKADHFTVFALFSEDRNRGGTSEQAVVPASMAEESEESPVVPQAVSWGWIFLAISAIVITMGFVIYNSKR